MFTQQEVEFLLELYEKNISSVASVDEFREDISRFDDIYKSLKSYNRKKSIGLRQTLNNFIILENCFGPVSIGLIIRKCPEELKTVLFAILEYTGRLPLHLREKVNKQVLQEIRNL